jgi:hypothetical protein
MAGKRARRVLAEAGLLPAESSLSTATTESSSEDSETAGAPLGELKDRGTSAEERSKRSP